MIGDMSIRTVYLLRHSGINRTGRNRIRFITRLTKFGSRLSGKSGKTGLTGSIGNPRCACHVLSMPSRALVGLQLYMPGILPAVQLVPHGLDGHSPD